MNTEFFIENSMLLERKQTADTAWGIIPCSPCPDCVSQLERSLVQ